MRGTQSQGPHVRRQREKLILARLMLRFRRAEADTADYDDLDDSEEDDSDSDVEFTWEKNGTTSSSLQFKEKTSVPDINLGDMKIWLDELCHEEQRKGIIRTSLLREKSSYKRYQKLAAQLRSTEPGMNTTLLSRLKTARGPRDIVIEDLLLPLRKQALLPDTHESYDDMKQVLLTWNKRACSRSSEETLSTLQDLVIALEWRLRAAERVLSIVSDDTDSERYNQSAQNGILEPSRQRLLHAVHAYRPETRAFGKQDVCDLLVVMLTHVCAGGDGSGAGVEEVNLVYLSYKVMVWEHLLQNRFEHEKKRHGCQERREKAVREGDQMGLMGRAKQQKAHSEKIAEKARRDTLAKIDYARKELRRRELDDLLALTIFQVVQQSVSTHLGPPDWIATILSLLDAHAATDAFLSTKFEESFSALESTIGSTITSLHEISTAHDSVLIRALKFSGERLEGDKEEKFKARLDDRDTASLMQETGLSVVETRSVAREVARQLDGVEAELGALCESGERKNGELERSVRLAFCCNSGLCDNAKSGLDVDVNLGMDVDEVLLHGVVMEKSVEKAGPVRLS